MEKDDDKEGAAAPEGQTKYTIDEDAAAAQRSGSGSHGPTWRDIDGRGVCITRHGYRYDGFFMKGQRHGQGREIPVGWHNLYTWHF